MKIIRSISISEFLKRENNNLDLFRIVAACLVIVGHSYTLFPDPGEVDLIRKFTGFTYSGALAVKIFFFISGLVVTNSIVANNSFWHFAISRIFRVFPALILVCFISSYVLGPLLTTLTTDEYFNSPLTYNYFKDNIFLKTNYDLPGVFVNNTSNFTAVNGSLWTLPTEMGCYLFLFSIFLIGILKNKLAATIIFGIIIIEAVLPQRLFTYWISDNPDMLLLPASFGMGAILALNKEKIKINFLQVIGFSVLTYLLWNTRFVEMFFCISVFLLIINLSKTTFFLKLKIKNDISYGIYLWGFLVQQIVQHFIHGQTVYLKMFISAIIASAIAYVSWILVEKNSIKLGKYFIKKLDLQITNE